MLHKKTLQIKICKVFLRCPYCGNKIDAKLLIKINAEFPRMMRACGWEMDDLDTTDFERAKGDQEYRSERQKKRSMSGKSVNDHITRQIREANQNANAMLDELTQLKSATEQQSEEIISTAEARSREILSEAEARKQSYELDYQTRKKKLDARDQDQSSREEALRLEAERQAIVANQNKRIQEENNKKMVALQILSKEQQKKADEYQRWEDSLDAQRKAMTTREVAAQKKEAELKKKSSELGDKEKSLGEREQSLTDREKAIAEKEQQIEIRDQQSDKNAKVISAMLTQLHQSYVDDTDQSRRGFMLSERDKLTGKTYEQLYRERQQRRQRSLDRFGDILSMDAAKRSEIDLFELQRPGYGE